MPGPDGSRCFALLIRTILLYIIGVTLKHCLKIHLEFVMHLKDMAAISLCTEKGP